MKKLLPYLWAVIFLAAFTLKTDTLAGESNPPDRIPYTLFHDFETGELFGWEPYPYQQDAGYDALYFTRKSPSYNGNEYALARPVKANDTVELYQGFTRRLNMWTTSDTRVQMAVFLQSDRKPEKIELSLGTFDGKRYKHTINNPDANLWLELDIPAGAFRLENGRSLAAGEHIEVVTIEATYPIVYYLFTYTILMDEFQINGERQRRFKATDPVSTDFEKFDVSILNRHYYNGDTISLRTVPENGTTVNQVRGRLIDSRGHVVHDGIEFIRSGGEWVNDSIHRVSQADANGRWELQLTGRTEGGGEVHWGFEFLVPGEQVTQHPRLFFTDDELADRLENEDSAVAQRILENALSNTGFMNVDVDAINEGEDLTAEALTGGPYAKYFSGFGAFGMWRTPMNRLGNVIREGSFRYAFSGDREAGEKAKEALLKLCSFEKWNNNWMLENKFWTYYPVGYTLKPVAYAYDMINDLLSEEEKQFVRDAIMEKGLKMFHRDMVEMNRMPSNNTNHIAVIVSGHGLAATAIYGEDPDNPYLEPYLSGIMTKARTFIDRAFYEDGSYSEPYGYLDMASRSLSEIFNTFERNFGVDWSTTTDAQHFYKYPIRATHSSGLYHSWGDTGRNYGGFNQVHSQWFVHRLGNPYLYDYIKPYWEEGNGGYMGYLYFRDDIEPVSRETLPTSKAYEAQGVVLRSGWEDESTIITSWVGPHANHFHYDKGSVQIMTNGQELLTNPGIGRGGYYRNLEFVVYDIHAIAHNVMLVDNDAESQKPGHYDNDIAALRDWTRMEHTFTGELADAVTSNLAPVYKDKLRNYTRTLLYTKEGPLFLFDEVESVSGEGHMYNWLFHAPQNESGERSLVYDGEAQRMTVDRSDARLTMDVLSPRIAGYDIEDRDRSGIPESFIKLNSHRGLNEVNFLAVLVPEARTEGEDFGPRPIVEHLEAPGWTGARVDRGQVTDYGYFRTSRQVAGTVEGFTTDASRFTASLVDGVLAKAYFEGSTFEGHGLSVVSETQVMCAITPHGSSMNIEVKTGQPTQLSVGMGQEPSQVLLDGETGGEWNYDPGVNQLTLRIPEGRIDISVQ